MAMEFIEYPDRDMLALSLADRIAGQLTQALRTQDRASLCVPGGTTPAPVFETLSGVEIDWSRVTVILGDERWVPGDHPRSNGRLLRRHLVKDRAEGAEVIDLYTGDADPDTGAAALAERVAGMRPLTVALVGMGTDMHTASMFPGAEGLAQALASEAPPVMAMRPAGEEEARITLTAPILRDAMHVHVLIMGPEKRAALERAQALTPEEAPIRALLDVATVHWAE